MALESLPLNTGLSKRGVCHREDHCYRLNVFDIYIPPLRERRDDILPLAASFLDEFADATTRRARELTPEAAQALLLHARPGNVRELRNVLERVMQGVHGNKAEASRQLGISRSQLYLRLRKHGFVQ